MKLVSGDSLVKDYWISRLQSILLKEETTTEKECNGLRMHGDPECSYPNCGCTFPAKKETQEELWEEVWWKVDAEYSSLSDFQEYIKTKFTIQRK